ncbi:MAG TPA: hypothetical protein VG675_05380 [Bryobacteraceae bacterium]|nr:hypothetical protein [Bryobacteraceae bacterium]
MKLLSWSAARAIALVSVFAAAGSGAGKLSIVPESAAVEPGKAQLFSASLGGKDVTASWTLSPGSGALSAAAGPNVVYTAARPEGTGVCLTGTVTVKAEAEGQEAAASVMLRCPADGPAWESRSIFGLQQSAASTSDPRLAYFLDFFIERALGDADAATAKVNVWGNVRLSTVAQQFDTTSVSGILQAAEGIRNVKINRLVEGAEFLTGIEYRPFLWRANPHMVRTLGVIAAFGAAGPFSPADSVSAIYQAPAAGTAQLAALQKQYPDLPAPAAGSAAYVAFAAPERTQFYRQWGLGIRISTFDKDHSGSPPGTYSLTLGQDEAVTGGRLSALVGHFDVFYPLPLNVAGFQCFYLFGTAALRLSRSGEYPPVFLAPAGANVTITDDNVSVLTNPSNRDMYRVGVGIDLLNLLRQVKITKE